MCAQNIDVTKFGKPPAKTLKEGASECLQALSYCANASPLHEAGGMELQPLCEGFLGKGRLSKFSGVGLGGPESVSFMVFWYLPPKVLGDPNRSDFEITPR